MESSTTRILERLQARQHSTIDVGVVSLRQLAELWNSGASDFGFCLSPDDDARFREYLGPAKLAEERAELDRQLSDPNCPAERSSELIDELITVDMAMRPLRKAMGTAENPAEAKPKKTVADTLRERGWKVSKGNEGGCVITGVQPPSVTKPSRTPEEQEILAAVARTRGQEFTDKNAELILAQARANGDL